MHDYGVSELMYQREYVYMEVCSELPLSPKTFVHVVDIKV